MASAETPSSVITRFAALLDEAGVPYMLTGSFASGIHGQPRASHAIDFVIVPTLGALHKLLTSLPEDRFYVSREAALDAYGRESLFNVVDMASGWKVDFICRKSRPFSLVEFERLIGVNYSCTLATTIFAEPKQVDGAPRRPRGGPGEWGERSLGHGVIVVMGFGVVVVK